jgi:hypothetical protein
MSRLDTRRDFDGMRARLLRWGSDSPVSFLLSLAMDSGPVGDRCEHLSSATTSRTIRAQLL